MHKLLKQQLWNAYESVLDLQVQLQPLLTELDEIPRDESCPGVPGARAWVEEGVVRFMVPSVPPIMKGATHRLQRAIRDRWMHWLVYAYVNNKIDVIFDRALVVVSIYTEAGFVWDSDNRSIHAILNGVRNCRLVADDDWQHLSYLVQGFGGFPENKTEIAVMQMEDTGSLLRVLERNKVVQTGEEIG